MRLYFLFFFLNLFIFNKGYAQDYGIYTGKRIHISSAKIQSESKRAIKISIAISNTGRQDVRLHSGLNKRNVAFTFGETFKNEKIAIYKDLIVSLVLEQNTTMHAGQLYTPKPLKIKKAWLHEKVKRFEPVLPDLPKGEIERSEERSEETPIKETTYQTSETIIKPEPEPLTKEPNETSMSPIGELPKPELGMQCFDLVIDNLVIEKSTKRYLEISFDLVNYGQGIFSFNRKNPSHDNYSIKTFFASIPRLTRGSLVTGGEHFDELFKEKKFELGFGESITGSIKIPLEKMTKFTPVIILELDPFSAIIECDKVNNVSTVVWKGK